MVVTLQQWLCSWWLLPMLCCFCILAPQHCWKNYLMQVRNCKTELFLWHGKVMPSLLFKHYLILQLLIFTEMVWHNSLRGQNSVCQSVTSFLEIFDCAPSLFPSFFLSLSFFLFSAERVSALINGHSFWEVVTVLGWFL